MISFAPTLFSATTDIRDRDSVWTRLQQVGYKSGGEWFVKEGRIVSFRDLREEPWPAIVDLGSLEEFAADEWAHSDDVDITRDFVRLLNSALREKLYPLVRRWPEQDVYAFSATPDLRDRRILKSGKKGTGKLVFSAYTSKRTGRRVAYRHQAFATRFERHDGTWYLEILPTYLFTSDGRKVSGRNGSYVAGIKRLERNPAVLGSLRVCAEVLTRPTGLLNREYPFLTLGPLARVRTPVGIDDVEWEARGDRGGTAAPDDRQGSLWA